MVDPSGKGFNGAVFKSSALVVDALTFSTILLVGDFEGAFSGLQESFQTGSVGDSMSCLVSDCDVAEPECDSEFLAGGGLFGVLANSQEIVESNIDEVSNGLEFCFVLSLFLLGLLQKMNCDGDGDGQLWSGRGVASAVGLYLPLKAGVVDLPAAVPVEWVWPVIQFEGLADGAKRCLNRANSDLMSSSCSSLTYEVGKTREEVNSAAKGDSREKRVHSSSLAEGCPMLPISQLDFGSLIHDPIG